MLGKRIDERRQELSLSQKELAARSGLSPQYVSLLIKGERGHRLSVRVVKGLSKALKVNQKFFFSESTLVDNSSTEAVR